MIKKIFDTLYYIDQMQYVKGLKSYREKKFKIFHSTKDQLFNYKNIYLFIYVE